MVRGVFVNLLLEDQIVEKTNLIFRPATQLVCSNADHQQLISTTGDQLVPSNRDLLFLIQTELRR